MKITKQQDNYLLSNELGEYHLSIEDYEKLGETEAIKLATKEIQKKSKSSYGNMTINFDQALSLGFCKYGIEDFCNKLELDIDSEYSIEDLKTKLTPEAFLKYPSECKKLFGKDVLNLFGGVKKFLSDNRTVSVLNYVLYNGYLEDNVLHELSCQFAESSLSNFESVYPNDNRPRLAIEAKEKFIKGEITEEELSAADSAASSAAESAARSAAWSAESAAYSAAYSAARSAAWSAYSAAWSAAYSAASSAAESAESAAYSAAYSAARSAARSAAWSAAYSAADSVAESAAYSAARSAAVEGQINTVLKHLQEL